MADDVHLAFGGVAPKTITAPKTEALLRGQPWTEANVTAALKTLAEDVWISPDAPGAAASGFVPRMRMPRRHAACPLRASPRLCTLIHCKEGLCM